MSRRRVEESKEKENALQQVSKRWRNLKNVNDELRNDEDVVRTAMINNTKALEYAGNQLLSDGNIMLRLAKIVSFDALTYSDQSLKDNNQFILDAIAIIGEEFFAKNIQYLTSPRIEILFKKFGIQGIIDQENDNKTFNEFYKITQLTKSDLVDFICTESISKVITNYLLKKHNNTCIFDGGEYLKLNDLLPIDNQEEPVLQKLLNKYIQCSRSNLILCVNIRMKGRKSWHRNILMLNPILKTIEYYEPHGAVKDNVRPILESIEEFFNRNNVTIKLDLDFSKDACPIPDYGSQTFEILNVNLETDFYIKRGFINRETGPIVRGPRGYCCMWSWLIMEFRLLFPGESIKTYSRILNHKLQTSKRSLNGLIQGYAFEIMKVVITNINANLPDDFQVGKNMTLTDPIWEHSMPPRIFFEANDRTIEDFNRGVRKIKLFRNNDGKFGIRTGIGEYNMLIVDVSENLEKYNIKLKNILEINNKINPIFYSIRVDKFLNSTNYHYNSVVLTFEL